MRKNVDRMVLKIVDILNGSPLRWNAGMQGLIRPQSQLDRICERKERYVWMELGTGVRQRPILESRGALDDNHSSKSKCEISESP